MCHSVRYKYERHMAVAQGFIALRSVVRVLDFCCIMFVVCVDVLKCNNIKVYCLVSSAVFKSLFSDFIFLGSKITADGDCSHEIKRRLLLGRKVRTNLDSIFKSRDITLPTKVHLVKAMVFPVVMYGCESWTVKKAER